MPGRTYSFRDRRWRYSRFRLAGISYGGFIDLLWRPGLIRKISVSLAIFMLVFVARTIDTPVRGPLDRYLEVLLVPGKESPAGSAWSKITANLKPRSLLAGLLGVDLEALSGQAQEAGSFLIGQPGETGSSPQSSGRSPVQVSPAPELALPVIGQLSSGFGPRMNPVNGKPEFHTGLDLAAPDGTPVRSVLPGTVTEVVEDDRWGRNILIDHPEGWQSFYAHLSETFARKGEKVSANQVIGAVGQTGLSTGNHLHFELRRNGIPSDPAAWLAEAVSAGSP